MSNRLVLAAALALLPLGAFAQSANDAARSATSTFAGHAAPAPNVVVGTGTFSGAEPTMSPRFFRSGTPGDPCAEFSSGTFQYQEVTMFSDASGQLTANFDPQTCSTGIFVTFHTAPFNPASICDNYLYSFGSSAAFTETFAVPANSELRMVVSGVAAAPGVACGPYAYSVTGADATPPVAAAAAVPAPSLNGWSLALLALLVGGVGIAVTSRRS
jgi:hypothetical protein